jgi:hypothetical protein
LYYGTSLCHGIKGPNTYEFDLASATWQRQAEVAPHFGVFDWGGPVLQLAYDAAAQRSVVYSVDRLATYDAVRHAWDALVVPNERVGSEYNHYRVAVAFDDVRRRTVLVGTKVTAVDVVARTSAVLVAGPPGPSSPPPIASPLR